MIEASGCSTGGRACGMSNHRRNDEQGCEGAAHDKYSVVHSSASYWSSVHDGGNEWVRAVHDGRNLAVIGIDMKKEMAPRTDS